MDYIDVTFVSNLNNSKTSVRLYSHYTCLYGKESGEGKSFFISTIEDGLATDTISVEISDPAFQFAVADAGSLPLAFSNPNRYVILVDEVTMLNGTTLQQANKSHHLFICVARAMPLKMNYPLKGIYSLVRTLNDGLEDLDIQQIDPLPIETNFKDRKNVILTEAKSGRSEHELLSVYLDNVTGANGRDRLEKYLRKETGSVLVVADLGNIGIAYSILMKRCSKNPNIKFYDYACFEQLLYESKLVKVLGNRVDASAFDFFSIERWYEVLVEKATEGTNIEVNHGKALPKAFLDKGNFDKVFNSKVGKGLKEYIELYGDFS